MLFHNCFLKYSFLLFSQLDLQKIKSSQKTEITQQDDSIFGEGLQKELESTKDFYVIF